MFRHLKFAAALLALVILSVPSFAVVTCIGGQVPAAAQMHCPAGCPMMAETNAAPAMQLSARQYSGAPCCKVSRARPSPNAVLQAPVTGSIASQDGSTGPGVVPTPFLVRRQQVLPVRWPESPQSLLCVFLI